ncbi:MAG: hypothetical protein KH415_20025 [Clostridium sp.]|nr:hypothetical protein [Clostridium sp.]
MYKAKFYIRDRSFSGTLDFYVIKNIVSTLKKSNANYTVQLFIKNLLQLDSEVVHLFLFESIARLNNITKKEFENLFLGLSDTELVRVTRNSVSYINELMEKCIPLNESENKRDIIFVDELEEDYDADWDFEYMEYLWHSVLNRKDPFWYVTPKNLFSQLDIYKKSNGKEDSKVQYI